MAFRSVGHFGRWLVAGNNARLLQHPVKRIRILAPNSRWINTATVIPPPVDPKASSSSSSIRGSLDFPNDEQAKIKFNETFKIAESAVTRFLSPIADLFALMTKDVQFEDKIWGYTIGSRNALSWHLMKVRAYLQYKSPRNSMKKLDSYIDESNGALVVIWNLTSTRGIGSSYKNPFDSSSTNTSTHYTVMGAVEFYAIYDAKSSTRSLIKRIVLRPVTRAEMDQLKTLKRQQEEAQKPEIFDSKKYI